MPKTRCEWISFAFEFGCLIMCVWAFFFKEGEVSFAEVATFSAYLGAGYAITEFNERRHRALINLLEDIGEANPSFFWIAGTLTFGICVLLLGTWRYSSNNTLSISSGEVLGIVFCYLIYTLTSHTIFCAKYCHSR